ncbi:MAG: NAD-dependent epimerase/dehydratase family protein [Nitrospiria bacterium]
MGTILVTGATGFTGKNLCKRLIDDGHQVAAFVRTGSDIRDLQSWKVDCRIVDIKNKNDVLNHFHDFEKVFHIAAAYRMEHADRDEFHKVNVEATKNLLEAAKTRGVRRFIHCSTVGVQGDIQDPPADENYRMEPGDHYQRSKVEGELLAKRYFEAGLPGVVVRPVGIYGPGDTRFLKLFRPVNKGRFVMIGSGKTLYHMTYIDDLIQGFILAGEKIAALGEVFTIGGPQYTTIGELVDKIADALGKPHPRIKIPFFPIYLAAVLCDALFKPLGIQPPIYPRRVEFFSKDRAFSIEKARRLLGYEPAFPLEVGLKRTADWYREKGLI